MGTVEVHVFDKAFRWQGLVTDLRDVTAHRRHLDVSTGTFATSPDIDLRDALVADGAQAVVMVDGEPFMSGWVTSDAGDIDPGAPLTYEVTGHEVLLWDVRGWPVPGASLSAQTVAYWKRKAAAETVVKAAVRENASRLGLPVTVAPDRGRGGTVDVSLRFHPLIDRMHTQLLTAGVGVSVALVEGQGLRVDVYEATRHDLPLDAASGVLTGGTWKRNRPKVTRVVGGAQGEAEARVFYGPKVAAWESSSPRKIETFVDARDTDVAAEVDTRLREALDEGAATYDLALELDSTDEFSYGMHWRPGDVVPLQVRSDVTIYARIDEAELTITDGVRVRPVIGGSDDPMLQALNPLIQSVVALGRDARNQAVR